MNSNGGDLALVMSGGGARAAYQIGFLNCLAQLYPELKIPILTGVSAGAINATYLANQPGTFSERVEGLSKIWKGLTTEQMFRVDSLSIVSNVVRWSLRLLLGGASHTIKVRSLLDTSPLEVLLEEVFDLNDGYLIGIQRNLGGGELKAIAITASNYSTGQSVSWVQGRELRRWERAHRKGIQCALKRKHILASVSLPFFFPAVEIGGHWYGDGGIRMTAPLSPAIHLGASRILAISTHYAPSYEEDNYPNIDHYPPPIQVAGALFDAIFLDVFDNDALRLERINRLVARLPEQQRYGLRPVKLLLSRPSQDLGKLANEYESTLPRSFRFMTRGLGTQETRSNDVLSLLMFQPDYLERLMELGREDAHRRSDEIREFLEK
ncbi:patatin-like phospholipase family protein [Nitrosococcus watsonii]|uniref:Patatin n=1 Tax=Nitrosococcus watsoni (strain C-113) TaxID=105559 RepID=D8K6N8_NITWC|nr:patatin-like phospholipase family protein [Nitrosococcus watsonii]ADJ28565.1 Patatin [Nitrosococcus watsonii C-113]